MGGSTGKTMVKPLVQGETEAEVSPLRRLSSVLSSSTSDSFASSGAPRKRTSSDTTATSGGQYADSAQTLIFLDWDDTIFPTTAIFEEWGVAKMLHCELPDALQKQLAAWRQSFEAYLNTMRLMTERCVVVTNSKRPWVQTCLERFAPDLVPLLDVDHGIHVVYAGEVQRRKSWGTLRPVMRGVPGDDDDFFRTLTKVKQGAMRKAAREFYSKYPGQTWKNILSIGDMPYEHNAVQEMTFMRRAPARERLRTKAITLPSEPSVSLVTFRLEFLARVMPAIVHYDGDISVQLQAFQDHSKALAAALEMPALGSLEFPDSAWGPEPTPTSEGIASLLKELDETVQTYVSKIMLKKYKTARF
mmetsp:Transcript_8716/g.16512  ORF Transcript_8716/g.16512 Transcript_8716/m.16512 type:complete len:359 (+) Transcript_8716:70-1146(+)